MIALPTHGRVYLACGSTDMRRGFDGLAVMVQEVLMQDPHSGARFAFRGKRGDLIKLLWWDGQGLCLFAKRLEKGRFVWPIAATGTVSMSAVCEKIVQAPAPDKAIARGKASFRVIGHIIVSKYDHHLPLYRQAEMMAAQGIDIDRSTLAGWTGQGAALLDPIVARIREMVLSASKAPHRRHARAHARSRQWQNEDRAVVGPCR